jgi:CRISPR type IV-associated protein Csf1
MSIVRDLPTRADIRGWLLDPPDPPFRIAIAESGQKHILPWAQTGLDRDYYPVQFELDAIWIRRANLADLLGHYESLMALGFSKTEIDSGDYHSDRLMRAIQSNSDWDSHEQAVAAQRGSRLLALVGYVALCTKD